MSRVIIGVLLIICLLFSANGLNRMLPEKPRLNSNMGRRGFTLQMIASMLNINRLVVGWLWVQFDSDSTNLSKNYHRLLPTLELITAIQPDEFVAHGLLCYMRCVHAKNSDETEKYKEAYTELERASKEFPNNPRGHYELAYINAIFLKDYGKALPYAKEAFRLEQNKTYFLMLDFITKSIEKQKDTRSTVEPIRFDDSFKLKFDDMDIKSMKNLFESRKK